MHHYIYIYKNKYWYDVDVILMCLPWNLTSSMGNKRTSMGSSAKLPRPSEGTGVEAVESPAWALEMAVSTGKCDKNQRKIGKSETYEKIMELHGTNRWVVLQQTMFDVWPPEDRLRKYVKWTGWTESKSWDDPMVMSLLLDEFLNEFGDGSA